MKNLILIIIITSANGMQTYTNMFINIFEYRAKAVFNTIHQSQCKEDLRSLITDAILLKPWALDMIDANPKIPPGILSGNVKQLGNYDQCIGIKTEKDIKGQYCLAKIKTTELILETVLNAGQIKQLNGNKYKKNDFTKFSTHSDILWGFCAPASCNGTVLQDIGNILIKQYFSQFVDEVIIEQEFCSTNESEAFTTSTVLAILFFGFIALIVLLSTSYDLLIYQKRKVKEDNVLICFSLYTNLVKLVSIKTKEEKSFANIGAMNGIRALSVIWVILGHSVLQLTRFPIVNIVDILKHLDHWISIIVIAALYTVDTFLAISGFLVVYIFIKIHQRKVLPLNIATFYLHRIIRLSPLLLVIIIFAACLFKHLGNGPQWNLLHAQYAKQCETYWLSTIFYIMNYSLDISDYCINQTWYLAADTQLYFLSPILTYFLLKRPRWAFIGLGFTFITSTIAAFATTLLDSWPHIWFTVRFNTLIYYSTHIRITSWIVGAAYGYFFTTPSYDKFTFNKKTAILGWIIHLSIMSFLCCFEYIMRDFEYNLYIAAFYNAFSRPLWAMGVCWIIFACSKGFGGIINSLLSQPIFIIICRISYSMFLTHMIVINFVIGQRRVPGYFSCFSMFSDFILFLILTIGVSIPCTLIFESPIFAMERIAYKKYLAWQNKKKE